MFFLFSLASSLRPVIFVPGMFGSNLYVTGDDIASDWYCPKTLDDSLIWHQESYFHDPLQNCVEQWLQLSYDSTKNTATSKKNADVSTKDFGGFGGFSDNVSYSFLPHFEYLRKYLEKFGYVEKTNLFGAPYDWRFAPNSQSLQDFYVNLKNLITEKFVSEKFVLIAHGYGSVILQYFLTSCVDDSFKSTYIQKVVYIAPTFGGSLLSNQAMWTGKEPFGIFPMESSYAQDSFNSLGSLHAQLTNAGVFGSSVVFTDPDGKTYTASQFADLLSSKGKLVDDNSKLFELSRDFFTNAPKSTGVQTAIIYNSKRDTPVRFTLSSWDSDDFTSENGKGDGFVSSDSIENICKSIGADCSDIGVGDQFGDHWTLLFETATAELLYQYVTN